MRPETDCARYQALVDQDQLEEGELSAEQLGLLSSHPQQCAACAPEAALWERLAQVREACARQSSAPAAPGPAVERLLGRAQERRLSVRRQRLAWVVAPAAAAAVLLGVLFVVQRPATGPSSATPAPPATVRSTAAHLGLVSGAVQVAGTTAMAGRQLLPGEPLSTADGMAVVVFDDSTRVFVEPRSTIVLRAGVRAHLRLGLVRGAATFQVAPRPAGARFEVEAGWARAEVLGTLFEVATLPLKPRVAVAQGRVRVVRRHGDAVILSAGHQVTRQGSPHPLTTSQRKHLLRRLALASLLPTRAGGVLLVRTTPTAASLRLDGRRLGATPLSVQVVPGDYALSLSRPGFLRHHEELRVAQSERLDVIRTLRPRPGLAGGATAQHPGPTVVTRAPRPTGPGGPGSGDRTTPRQGASALPASSAVTVATLLQKIRAQRARGDWRGAVSGYRALRRLHPRAPEARTCLVLMGQIQLRHLGQTRAALRSFERYLRGGGSLAPEAAWGRIQALGNLGRRAAEGRACRTFLKRHPRSLYAPQVKKRLHLAKGTGTP